MTRALIGVLRGIIALSLAGSLVVQVTAGLVAFAGATVAVNVPVSPGASASVAGATDTPVTGVPGCPPSATFVTEIQLPTGEPACAARFDRLATEPCSVRKAKSLASSSSAPPSGVTNTE